MSNGADAHPGEHKPGTLCAEEATGRKGLCRGLQKSSKLSLKGTLHSGLKVDISYYLALAQMSVAEVLHPGSLSFIGKRVTGTGPKEPPLVFLWLPKE